MIEQAVINLAIENPAIDQLRASQELMKQGTIVSFQVVYVLFGYAIDLETLKKNASKLLEAKSAQDGILLTEEQLANLEKKNKTN